MSGITGVTSVSPVNFTALSGHKMYAEMQKLSKPDSGEYEGSDGKRRKTVPWDEMSTHTPDQDCCIFYTIRFGTNCHS